MLKNIYEFTLKNHIMKPKYLLSATLILFTVSTLLFGIEKIAWKDYEGKNLSFKSFRDSEMKALPSAEKMNPVKLKAGLKNETKYLLDSVLVSDNKGDIIAKTKSTYDNHGNELSYESLELVDSLNSFIGVYKYINTYTNDDKQVSNISFNWDYIKNEWLQSYKTETTYNNYGLDYITTDYEWDSDKKKWVWTNRNEYIYYPDSAIKENTFYSFNKNKNTWINNTKYVYDYNHEENYDTSIDFNWDSISNSWIASIKLEYFMDRKGHRAIAVNSLWVEQLQKFFVMNNMEYSYFNDELRGFISSEWMGRYWSGVSKAELHFDSLGRADGQTYYSYSNQNKKWFPRFRYEVTFNQNGETQTEIRSEYDINSDTWTYDYKWELEYDKDGNILNEYFYIFENTWNLSETYRYYYSEKQISNLVSQKKNIILAQNPVRDMFMVKGLDGDFVLKIFNLKGNLVMLKSQNGNKPVNVADLQKGIYIYKVIYSDGIIDGKMIKE